MRGSGGPFPWVSAQTERVQDWHSLDRHEDIRGNLADHAENTTCPLLVSPKISGRTQLRGSENFTAEPPRHGEIDKNQKGCPRLSVVKIMSNGTNKADARSCLNEANKKTGRG